MHIFPDGNKRTTTLASLALLYLAGVSLDIEDAAEPESNEVYRWIQDVVANGRTTEELAAALRLRGRMARSGWGGCQQDVLQ